MHSRGRRYKTSGCSKPTTGGRDQTGNGRSTSHHQLPRPLQHPSMTTLGLFRFWLPAAASLPVLGAMCENWDSGQSDLAYNIDTNRACNERSTSSTALLGRLCLLLSSAAILLVSGAAWEGWATGPTDLAHAKEYRKVGKTGPVSDGAGLPGACWRADDGRSTFCRGLPAHRRRSSTALLGLLCLLLFSAASLLVLGAMDRFYMYSTPGCMQLILCFARELHALRGRRISPHSSPPLTTPCLPFLLLVLIFTPLLLRPPLHLDLSQHTFWNWTRTAGKMSYDDPCSWWRCRAVGVFLLFRSTPGQGGPVGCIRTVALPPHPLPPALLFATTPCISSHTPFLLMPDVSLSERGQALLDHGYLTDHLIP